MSTSPEKDLHSVYIDGEMPEKYVSQYKAAVEADPAAKAEFEKMQSLHNILQEDAKSKTVDQSFADKSFERLQSRMSYSRTISVTKKSYVIPFAKYASSFAAAAAVFAVVFIPMHNKAVSDAGAKEVAAIEIKTENNIQPISEKQVVIDGSIRSESLSQGIALASLKKSDQASEEAAAQNDTNLQNFILEEPQRELIEQKTVRASAMVSGGRRGGFRHSLPSVDPFRPNFSAPPRRMSVPNFQEMSNNLEDTQKQQ
ncbi:MAG: hypothetical protein KBT11_01720 [Treponema sp.]|nr:hypothetical protein [Candidatus Treponema equifaecale]